MTAEAFISVDVESDGEVPGLYSMLSFGACLPGYRTRTGLVVKLDGEPTEWPSFYAELKPISERFNPEALAVSGLDRDRLIAEGEDPAAAMRRFDEWVASVCDDLGQRIGERARPVFGAYPAPYDWMFMRYYAVAYADGGSFGHSTCLDMKTEFSSKSGRSIPDSAKRNMPTYLLGRGQHTHNALDDAREQGDMLMNLLDWNGRR